MQLKKLLTLSLLSLGVLAGARAQTCGTTITSYPYFENFEGATAANWTSGGTNSSWALGTPVKPIINSAASGTNAWVTSTNALYKASERSYVESPCFNMTSLTAPMVEFKIWWSTEFSIDGAVLQSSIDGGGSWQVVGAYGDPMNWYNDNTVGAGPGGQAAGTAVGWTGTAGNGGSGGWVTVRHELTGLGGKQFVKFRVAFASDGFVHDEGIAFDNFSVFEMPANDGGLVNITAPAGSVLPGVQQPISVTVRNFGAAPLTTATLGFSINGVAQPTYAWSGNLPTNATSPAVQIGTYTFPIGKHTIKAYSKLPNGSADASALNDTVKITITSCNPLSGNYTINKGAPASATNYTSFSAAVQDLASCGVSGPVTFTVAPNSGLYTEQVIMPVIAGVSATNTITFEGNGNTLTATNTTADNSGVIILKGTDYVKINNLKISLAPNITTGFGVQLLNGADNNTISNCTIDMSVASGPADSNLNGIVAGSTANATGNYANNLLLQNNTITGGYNGVSINGTVTGTTTAGNRIIGNRIRDSYNYAMYLNIPGNGMIVESNDISRPARINSSSLYAIYMSGSANGAVISKNRIHNTHDAASVTTGAVYAIYMSGASGTVGNEVIVKNNLIYNLNNNVGTVYGFFNLNSNNTYYYHNTVSLDNPAFSYATVRGMHFASASTNIKFINNIISLSRPANAKHAIYVSSNTMALNSNNNVLYTGGTGNIGFFTTDKATLADWKGVNSNAYDQASISVDPQFVSASYLQPLAPSVDNAGQAIATVTDDVNGVTRSTSTPDPGAYEFTPAATDAGVTVINTPTSPVTPGSQPVNVTLKNFGTANLTAATISWSVNGVAQPNYNWAGSLSNLQATTTPLNIGSYNFVGGNYTLKVWSKNPNGATDQLAANDTTILKVFSCAPLAGNYTVNKNNPTAGTNYNSISEIAQRLTTCGVSGPVTVTVVSGTGPYNEQVEIGNIPYTSAANTVTFEGSGNTVSTIPGVRQGIFVLNGSKYTKLNNFVITLDPAATYGWGVQLINGTDNNTISNNTINLPLASTSNNIQGILAGSGNTTAGINASNTKIQNNIINGGFSGIQLNGNTGNMNAMNNQIVGNQLKDQASYGVYLNNTNGTLIEGNDISRPNRNNSASITGFYVTGSQGAIISKNRFHNTHDQVTATAGSVNGIFIASASVAGNENIVKNNVIYNIKPINGIFFGLASSGGSNTYYYHNTIVAEPGFTYLTLRGLSFNGTAVTNVKFINNIISLPGTCNAKHAIYLPATGVSLVSNNNDLHVGTGNIGYLGADKVSMADWQAANSNAYDQNSVSSDPVFVNVVTGNLKPTLATLDNQGQSVPAVTDDILGVARHATTPDLGAYEFGVPANDVSIIAISGPGTTGCGYTTSETITVTIKNFGSATQTSIPVTYSINGTPMAATPETWTGTLTPSTTTTYTFAAKANMSVSGPYQIIAKTLLAGDLNAANDADTLNASNSLISGFPVPFDFETAATGIGRFSKVTNQRSNITENAAASFGTASTKGMLMDGVDNANWNLPAGTIDAWTINPDNFAGAYICFNPAGGTATDSLWLTLDLKQTFKTAAANTNFRVTVNGTQVGPTFRPPFSGTPINWQKVKINLYAYKTLPTIQIGFESSVKEAFAAGAGTANLIDNITFKRRLAAITGTKSNTLESQLHVFPNPSTGSFFISLENGKEYELKVTDLAGKVMLTKSGKGDTQLNLENAAKGIYLLTVQSQGKTTVKKLIVE